MKWNALHDKIVEPLVKEHVEWFHSLENAEEIESALQEFAWNLIDELEEKCEIEICSDDEWVWIDNGRKKDSNAFEHKKKRY